VLFRSDGTEVPGEQAASIFVAHNRGEAGTDVSLPTPRAGMQWKLVSDTAAWMEGESNFAPAGGERPVSKHYGMHGRSVAIFVEAPATQSEPTSKK
jgi:glycogen operon protein